ncbi:MAG: DUF917 family protein [Oscillospiraceae bacterium]
MNKGMKLDKAALDNAILGGTILGGGGGGSPDKGREFASIAVDYTDLRLVDIQDIDEDALLLTVGLVGAPNAANKFLYASHFAQTIKLFEENCNAKIGGIITNENGGEASVNGWLQSALTGLPLIDAPCNGRAHPTGVMGSMNLHLDPSYITCQACAGGNPETGNYVECVLKGTIDHTAKLVRMASVEAGGLVAVARNPVTAAYAKENAAIGGISHAIALGEVYSKGCESSVEQGVNAAVDFLNGSIVTRGVVEEFDIRGEGGFDVGRAVVNGHELTFWNEYMTLDKDGKRVSTFPNLIMTIDAKTGEPVTTAMMAKGREVYIINTDMSNLHLSKTMYEKPLLRQIEDIIGKKIVEHLNF